MSHTSTSYLVYFSLVWREANRWTTITPNTKGEHGLYPPTQRSFQAFAIFEQIFYQVGLGHGSGTVVGLWFPYGAALRNLARNSMRTTR